MHIVMSIVNATAQGRAVTYSADTGEDGIQTIRQHWYGRILQRQRDQGNDTAII